MSSFFTLDVLIPSLEVRSELLNNLLFELETQISRNELRSYVTIKTYIDNGQNHIGFKRNQLIKQSGADYVCFLDDDDWIHPDYIFHQFQGCQKGLDCVELRGTITTNGLNPRTFIHSIKFKEYKFEKNIYYRPPNHLNAIKRSLASQVPFPEVSFGEDTVWALTIARMNLLNNEAENLENIYYYLYTTKGKFPKLLIQIRRFESIIRRLLSKTKVSSSIFFSLCTYYTT